MFFWRDWVRILRGFASSVRHRRVSSENERLAWLIILATIPVGLAGLLLEHLFRTVLGRPIPAAAFLLANGVILLVGERLRRRTRIADAARITADHRPPTDPGTVRDLDAGITGPEADLRSDQRIAVTSRPPVRPRATRPRRNAKAPAPSSLLVTAKPEDFSVPVAVDAGGIRACTCSTRPPSRT